MLDFSKIPALLLLKGLRGLERETLRLDHTGHLSQSSHEQRLGVSIDDPIFTVDFAECQVEIVSPPHQNVSQLIESFGKIASELNQKLGDEKLWHYSMPPLCTLPEIKLAYQDGTANPKYIYRKGLCHRYGKMMQTICGIHYNFSFHDDLFPILQQSKNEAYFKIIRNFWRFYPLLIYLFGASPFCFENSRKPHVDDHSFLEAAGDQRYIGPHATSLRLSELGYHNPDVPELRVAYDNLEAYLKTLGKATSTIYEPYLKIPKTDQLNAYYLQMEGEHYAPIRPKANPKIKTRPLEALKTGGVHYIEVRILDLNPLLPLGIDLDTLAFIDLFLLHCLFTPEASSFDFTTYKKRALEIAKFGRKDPHIVQDGLNLLKAMIPLLNHLNNPIYTKAFNTQIEKLQNPKTLPSHLILTP